MGTIEHNKWNSVVVISNLLVNDRNSICAMNLGCQLVYVKILKFTFTKKNKQTLRLHILYLVECVSDCCISSIGTCGYNSFQLFKIVGCILWRVVLLSK